MVNETSVERFYHDHGWRDIFNKHLDLSSARVKGIKDVKGLEYHADLRGLDLSNNDIESIEGLDHLSNLSSLKLDNNKITRLDGLDNLTHLRFLSVKGNNIATW